MRGEPAAEPVLFCLPLKQMLNFSLRITLAFANVPLVDLAELRESESVNSKQLAVIAAKQEIQTREQFHAALAHVNALVKRPDIGLDEAKATLTKAEALRAWASFDRRLTVEEKKEANRAMTRTVRMLAELAEREQPRAARKGKGGGGSIAGPSDWLRRELGVSRAVAHAMRALVTRPDVYRIALTEGRNFSTVASIASTSTAGATPISRVAEMVKTTNTLERALKLPRQFLGRELTRIRKIRAWCEAYEHALVQRQVRESTVRK